MQNGHGKKTFKSLLESGKPIICAEGYVVELQRRGYCRGHVYIPEIILDKPHVIRNLHEEYAHAGSDILVACLYYVNRKKLEMVGKQEKFEEMNRAGLKVCREVADETGTLMAGNLCNSNDYDPEDPETVQLVRDMYKDQVIWAVEAGVDLFINETFKDYGEALLSLQVCQEYAPGVPCVVSLAPYSPETTGDGIPYPEALQKLYDAGATVVGYNCARGPETMIPLLEKTRETFKGPMSCCPLPFRTTKEQSTWLSLRDSKTGKLAFPENNDVCLCNQEEIEEFGEACKRLDIQYVGLCCGNMAKTTRTLAHVLDRTTPSDVYRTPHAKNLSYSAFANYRNADNLAHE